VVPSLDLFVSAPNLIGPLRGGNLDLDPPIPGLPRVLLRRLVCTLRAPPVPGAYAAVLDTGAPLTLFPHDFWHNRFGWRAGQHFDELSVAGIGTVLTAQVLSYRFPCRLARLRVPIELVGRDIKGDRLRLDSLVCLFAETGGPSFIILGLWGGAFVGSKLTIERQPNADDLQARLEF
jgi:hypothetical protein